ncbi:MAG: 1,4-dihydroxy-2-naphthoate octaprenyltransferase [Porphyromonas sp.]|nr:1,4-dihydroxy-2-naphthoate octaprenyltransferase [Porphyromonas sp.]
MPEQISRLSIYIGLLRPKTLFSGLSPIIVAVAYAYAQGYSDWVLAALLALIAVSAQIASNVANDLIDYRKGADTEARQGPLRPLSKGLIGEWEVAILLALVLLVLVAAGVAVMALTSWSLALVGLFVILGLFAYSGGPMPLSYLGLGDLAVLVFFGWVPVITSYYVLTGIYYEPSLYLLATAMGLASVNILVVNNYRDVEEDAQVGKRTLIVRMGRDFAPRLYLCCGMMSMLLLYPLYTATGMWILILYGALFFRAYKALQLSTGVELNKVLAQTARNVFFLALLVVVLVALKSW